MLPSISESDCRVVLPPHSCLPPHNRQSFRPPHASHPRPIISQETPLAHLLRGHSPRMVGQWSLPAAGLLAFPHLLKRHPPTCTSAAASRRRRWIMRIWMWAALAAAVVVTN